MTPRSRTLRQAATGFRSLARLQAVMVKVKRTATRSRPR